MPVITSANGKRALEMMRWGLVPLWSKDLKMNFSTFNARADGFPHTNPETAYAWGTKGVYEKIGTLT